MRPYHGYPDELQTLVVVELEERRQQRRLL
jgi:hypothetical protein